LSAGRLWCLTRPIRERAAASPLRLLQTSPRCLQFSHCDLREKNDWRRASQRHAKVPRQTGWVELRHGMPCWPTWASRCPPHTSQTWSCLRRDWLYPCTAHRPDLQQAGARQSVQHCGRSGNDFTCTRRRPTRGRTCHRVSQLIRTRGVELAVLMWNVCIPNTRASPARKSVVYWMCASPTATPRERRFAATLACAHRRARACLPFAADRRKLACAI
jgi:hypothetical protein